VDSLKHKLGQTPPKHGDYGGGQGGGGGRSAGGATHPSLMTVQEKMAGTCKDW
jgi:hypothetical protein